MGADEPLTLSDEQKQQLQQEEFVSELVSIRAKGDEARKNIWPKFWGSAGGAALITVLVGGLLGTVLNYFIQSGLGAREVEQARQKSKGEIAIISFRDHLDRRQETMKTVYSLIGRCASASQSLLTRTSFDTGKYPTTREKLVEANEQTHKSFQGIQAEWLSNRDSLGLLVSYYFEGKVKVTNSWSETKLSVSQYLECADSEYKAYARDYIPREKQPCLDEKSRYEKTIDVFTQSVESANVYPWKDYYPELSSPAP